MCSQMKWVWPNRDGSGQQGCCNALVGVVITSGHWSVHIAGTKLDGLCKHVFGYCRVYGARVHQQCSLADGTVELGVVWVKMGVVWVERGVVSGDGCGVG